jgi:hypothetical protein
MDDDPELDEEATGIRAHSEDQSSSEEVKNR